MDLLMGAVGVRGIARETPEGGGIEIAVTSDAMGVRTTSDAVRAGAGGNLGDASAAVTRLRLGLESTWHRIGTGDGGGLVAHEADGLREKGIAGSLAWDPRPEPNRVFALTLSQTIGGQASGGMGALLERETLTGLGAGEDATQRQLELKMGYGIGLLRGQLTATPEARIAVADGHRELRLGAQLGLAGSVRATAICKPARNAKSYARGDEGEAKEEPDEVPGRGPLEGGKRLVDVAHNEQAKGAKTMDLVAMGPAGRVHARENAMRRPRRRQATRPTSGEILAIARRPRRTALSPA